MSFNFGASPWKYKPVEGFVGFTDVTSKNEVENPKKDNRVEERKIVNNAPQAIIIEV